MTATSSPWLTAKRVLHIVAASASALSAALVALDDGYVRPGVIVGLIAVTAMAAAGAIDSN